MTYKNTKTSLSVIVVVAAVTISVLLSTNPIFAATETNSISIAKLGQAKERILNLSEQEFRETPVFMAWVDEKTSTLMVGIDDKATLSKAEYEMKVKQLVGDIPIQVGFGHFTPDTCTSRDSDCRPVIGGVKVYDGTNGKSGTLMIPATRSSTSGIIMSGHVADCTTGHTIDQTTGSTIGIVTVNPSSDRYSDSAFVPLNGGITSSQKIYKTSSTQYNIVGKKASSLTSVGTTVYMSGLTSGVTSGTIQAKGVGFQNQHCGVYDLNSQILANYASGTGDSGAPIFSTPDASNNVYIYGIHVGTANYNGFSYRVYSPWESIASELSVS